MVEELSQQFAEIDVFSFWFQSQCFIISFNTNTLTCSTFTLTRHRKIYATSKSSHWQYITKLGPRMGLTLITSGTSNCCFSHVKETRVKMWIYIETGVRWAVEMLL